MKLLRCQYIFLEVFIILLYLQFSFLASTKIDIALSVDRNSVRDMLIVARSIAESALIPENIVLHIVACDKNEYTASVFSKTVLESLQICVPQLTYDVVPFFIPYSTGFYRQLTKEKTRGSSHWISSAGADMVRFFIPVIFSNLRKILYLDNDILVTCCIEEIWSTVIVGDKVAGIIVDNLTWVTTTQFARHYNASHPLVMSSLRRTQNASTSSGTTRLPVSKEEWLRAIPSYPNDGVILFDILKYNQKKIFEEADEIASRNAAGEYVVGLGSQQFTALVLHDRWMEINPKGNLRHFPSSSLDYMLRYNYNGLLHFCGMQKPIRLCHEGQTSNYERKHSYTSWLTTLKYLNQSCPNISALSNTYFCLGHLITANSVLELVLVMKRLKIEDGIHIQLKAPASNQIAYRKLSVVPDAFSEIESAVNQNTTWTKWTFRSEESMPRTGISSLTIKDETSHFNLCEFASHDLNSSIYSSNRSCISIIKVLHQKKKHHNQVTIISFDLHLPLYDTSGKINKTLSTIKSFDFMAITPKIVYFRLLLQGVSHKSPVDYSINDFSVMKSMILQVKNFLEKRGFSVHGETFMNALLLPIDMETLEKLCRDRIIGWGTRINFLELDKNK